MKRAELNAAPFSAYNYLCTDPPIVGMGVTNRPDARFTPKDTARNIRRTGEFVINVVTEDLLDQMNICATDFPAGVNELEMAGLTTAPSSVVKVPRIAEAHAALECREFTTMEIGRSRIILGRVVAMYVEDRFVDPCRPLHQGRRTPRRRPHERPGQLRPHPRRHRHRPPHLLRRMAKGQPLTPRCPMFGAELAWSPMFGVSVARADHGNTPLAHVVILAKSESLYLPLPLRIILAKPEAP